MKETRLLPPGFEDLEPFVEYWGAKTTDERWDRRSKASMSETQAFYDAMLARAEEALSYLEKLPLHDMPEDAGRLCCLVLALAQASIAIELHGSPRAPYSPFPHGIRVIKSAQPFG